MSHEIRTPMNSIIGFSNLLSDENVDEASRKEYILRINRNSEQLLTLISDIIDLAKIESNQLSVSYSNVILENVFTDLMSYGQHLLKEKHKDNVILSYDPDPDQLNLNIESDLVRLTQILQNLLNNAIKFTQSGEIVIGYRVVDDTAIRLFVKDTGVGIDRKDFKIIFDQFRQIDGSDVRKFGGTGLGLAICRNLAHLLCGEIHIDSELGKGAIFNVELPILSGFPVGVDEDMHFANIKSSASQVVMMVDDDHDSLMLFSTMMRTEGVQVITADSGYKALEILEREALPDLVLMDLEMPVLSGVQTLKIIKEMYPDLKVVAQSAHALEGDKEKTMVAGFDNYISKPYKKQSLLQVIRGMN
jgi:CheY-like chemotaxis protein/anti-sigma regulatory factor (Ser/Thr protein kinase)|nr:ATP-binding protein [Bacteroidales bacterium]